LTPWLYGGTASIPVRKEGDLHAHLSSFAQSVCAVAFFHLL
jgi:hypothetical protein